jgi:HK97 gp10 family phage protein
MARNKDLADLTRRFKAIPDKVRRSVQPAVDQGADEIVARMQFLAPDDEATGALRGSIERTPGPVPLSATVSAGGQATTDAKGDDHALNLEYGTVKMRRHSFFWPSVNSLKKRVRGRVDRAISKAVKEAWQ